MRREDVRSANHPAKAEDISDEIALKTEIKLTGGEKSGTAEDCQQI